MSKVKFANLGFDGNSSKKNLKYAMQVLGILKKFQFT